MSSYYELHGKTLTENSCIEYIIRNHTYNISLSQSVAKWIISRVHCKTLEIMLPHFREVIVKYIHEIFLSEKKLLKKNHYFYVYFVSSSYKLL